MIRRVLNSRGDTIVEVLIAIAVMSFALGGAYTVVNRTLANSRQAQEHSEALQLASKQIEQIRSMQNDAAANANNLDTLFSNGAQSCIKEDQVIRVSASYPCELQGTVDYKPVIYYDGTNNYFKVGVTWPAATGRGNDSVELVYRTYRP